MIAVPVAVIAGIATLVNSAGVLASIVTPIRVWPPGERDWRYWLTWACWYPATAGLFLTGLLTWGSAQLVPLPLRVVGVVSTLAGASLAVAAISGLGVSETTGVEGQLRTSGLYRYSRNPQYVGDIAMTAGWIVATDSWLAAVVGVTYACYYFLLPFAEEPWLRREYGAAYDEYRQHVPRYVGTVTISRLLEGLLSDSARGRDRD